MKYYTINEDAARRLAENINKQNSVDASYPSVMIAGPSNFSATRKAKQNAARDRAMEEYKEICGLLDKIKSVGTGGISSDDPNAIEKLRAKLANLERLQERMKAANAALRLKDAAKADAKLTELGFSAADVVQLRTPDFCGRIGFPSYQLSNNNATIRATRARIEELEKRQAAPAPSGWEFDGGKVVINTELNRLQIVFDGRPDEDTRAALKSHGFRWAPSQGAWQRQFTDNAIRAAKRLTGNA